MKKTIKKRAFISAIAMLIVSAIVLTSSTFAWFSMAKRVEVKTMQLNITSPEGVQISGNTSAFTTNLTRAELDGTETTRFSAYAGNRNNFPSLISPASSRFGTNNNSMPTFYTASINDDNKLIAKTVTDETASDFGVVVFDLFVKVSLAQDINFGESTVTCTANPDVPCAMRIGVVNCGLVSEGAEFEEILGKKPTTNATTSNHVTTMYQLDAKHHTPYAVDKYQSLVIAGTTHSVVDGTYIETRYLNAATPTAGLNIPSGSVTTDGSYAYGALGTDVYNKGDAYFRALNGINKIRVYLWMEGQDVDCSNDVAGSTIDFNFVLTIA